MDRQHTHRMGALAMLASSLLFAVMAGLVRYANTTGNIDVTKMALYRFAVGLALLGTLAMFKRIELKFHHSPLLLARGVIGAMGVFLFFVAISKIGVGRGTVISYSYPIFAAVFGMLMLKERVGPLIWFAIALAFYGILLLSRDKHGGADEVHWIYYGLAILGSLCSGLAVVVVRKLRESDSAFAIFLAQCAMGFWMMIVPANIVPVEIGWQGGVLLVLIGCTAAAAQILMTYAYAHVPVATCSLIGMLVPALTMIVGFVFFSEEITRTTALGMFLVIVPCALVAIRR